MSVGVCAALPSVSTQQVQVCCNIKNFSRPLPSPLPSKRTKTVTSIPEALVCECPSEDEGECIRIFLRVCDDVPLVLDRELGCTIFVRDLLGEFAQLALPTAPVATLADALETFHPGVVLLATAPEFRTERLLVVANFDDVELLLRCDERLRGTIWFEEPCRNAAEWCARGSAQQSARAAVACFTEALKCDADAVDVLWSRAQAFARLGDWRSALADAERVLALDASHLKSAVCRAQALHALERYDDAAKTWALVATKLAPEGSAERVSARAGLAAALACAKQAKGHFDWPRLLAGSIRAADCATFVHRAVELGDTGAHGRGLLCREAIACGTLVLVEAPLNASSQGAISEARDELDMSGAFFDLLHRCHSDAVVREKIEQLSRAKVDASDAPFGRRLYGALATNVWGSGALFHWGSFFNHSCMPSCCMSMQAGLMVVQTTRALSAGDELTLAYFDLDRDYEDRVARCERRKFVCDCQRCVVDQAGQVGFRKLEAELDAFRSDRTTRFWESARFKQLGARIDADATARRCLDWRELACAAAALHKPPPDADRDTVARFFALLLQLQRAAAESRNINDAIDRCNGIEVARKWIFIRTLQQRLRAPPADVAASTAKAKQWLCTKLPAELVEAFVNEHF